VTDPAPPGSDAAQGTPPARDPAPAVPLEYQDYGGHVLARHAVLKPFLGGLSAGAAVSLGLWMFGWGRIWEGESPPDALLFSVPAIKGVIAIGCLCFKGCRAFGAGLLVSIALGTLIFFGSCVYHLAGG